MKYDFYQGTQDGSLRMVVEAGIGLPGHVDPKDWKPMSVDPVELAALEEDIAADIEDHGFSFLQLVPPPQR